jgi:hypothetical protein
MGSVAPSLIDSPRIDLAGVDRQIFVTTDSLTVGEHLPNRRLGHPEATRQGVSVMIAPVLGKGDALVALVLLLAVSGTAKASRPSSAPIKVHVALNGDRVVAGQTIKGEVLLTNTTTRTIVVDACADNGWLQVGLKGKGYVYEATSLLILCPPTIHLHPGINRFPVNVLTSYQSCSQPQGNSPTSAPRCTPSNGLPPLPIGKYSTEVLIFGMPHLTRPPNQVTVTLLRRAP